MDRRLNWDIQEEEEEEKLATAQARDREFKLKQFPETVEIDGEKTEIHVVQLEDNTDRGILYVGTLRHLAETHFRKYQDNIQTLAEAEFELEEHQQ